MDNKPTPTPPTPTLPTPQPIEQVPSGLVVKKKLPFKKVLLWGGLGLLAILIGVFVAAWLWYQAQLSPVGTDKNEKVLVTIEQGSSPAMIGELLEEKAVIHSSRAFGIYNRFNGTENTLQAGTYRLSPAESTPEIVKHLTSGKVDTFDITFLPGSTLADNRKVLIEAGYSDQEVDAALKASYDSPLFASKPANADLEGYIYGDTYKFGSGASASEILEHTFEVYNDIIVSNGLVEKFQAQGLTLYEGIILASIIQRESGGNDEPQIASVFFNRLAIDMQLGSDVTYQYIADKTGVERDVNLDSPYNTRRYTGLPPGPIATPGLKSLLAVANPAETEYLYFLSGDDNVTYFARTNAEHEANIQNHCKEKCLII